MTATPDPRSILVPTESPRGATARITLHASAGPASGTLTFEGDPAITVTPSTIDFALTESAPEQTVQVQIAITGDAPGTITPIARVDGASHGVARAIVDYPHLPRRTVLSSASLAITPIALSRGETQTIGYLPGSGDTVAESLDAVGYTVETLDEATIDGGDLSRFDAIVLGIRAYNTRPGLVRLHAPLMDYVAAGGRLIVQYNTNSRWRTLEGPIGPHPFHISRDRVTDEAAPLRFVDPDHRVLQHPNPIGAADLQGWVQERGLYFADSWDPAYETVFSANDPGEAPTEGALLIAQHGEGVFVYTGLSFFRQLPAGVPGATRLFANLLAL